MDYNESLRYLSSLESFGIKPGMQRISLLLEKLGHPEKAVHFVHVAGTNGKGSVTSMLTSIFAAAGLKTGKFISPHLVKWNERIQINGEDVSDEKLAQVITAVKEVADEVAVELEQPTQFEIFTAAAFLLFAQWPLDLVVVEVGMGGLLDSTNVIIPECVVITNVSMDHTDRCGHTIEEIAEQKAGIIKEGVPVVTAAESVALSAIIDKAAPVKADIHLLRRDFTAISLGGSIEQQKFLFRQGEYVATLTVSLGGDHQVSNAALAVAAARLLTKHYPSIDTAAIEQGLLSVKWPGRLERIAEQPDIILDGAHNLHGAAALRRALNKYYAGRSICFILGIMRDKDVEGIVRELVKQEDSLIAVPADKSVRAALPEVIAAVLPEQAQAEQDFAVALDKARQIAGSDGVICIAGSLYLVGRAKNFLAG